MDSKNQQTKRKAPKLCAVIRFICQLCQQEGAGEGRRWVAITLACFWQFAIKYLISQSGQETTNNNKQDAGTNVENQLRIQVSGLGEEERLQGGWLLS